MKKIREWISIKTAKAPGLIVLLAILTANIIFISIAALVVMALAPPSLENTDFWSCVYYAATMLITAYAGVVVEDIGETGAFLVLFCMVTVVIGMIAFTGAIIGYMSEFISSFITDADSGSRRLHISDHIVILNWNTRAVEIINELLYKNTKEKIVVLVEAGKDDILKDINERLSDTIDDIDDDVAEAGANMGFFKRRRYIRKNKVKNKLTVIVREGDCWSYKQLCDISIKSAKTVIILSNDISGALECGAEYEDIIESKKKGDVNTVKTLLQVAHITSEEGSAENQLVVVEVEDEWTLNLVETVIEQKKRRGRCKIIPLAANHILGQIFSQFSIMPELNIVYNTLFSNKGASLYVRASDEYSLSEPEFITEFLDSRTKAIPLTVIHDEDGKYYRYYMADTEQHILTKETVNINKGFEVSLNPDFEIKNKHIIILGHNSKSAAIMEGFKAFSAKWKKKDGPEALDVILIDNEFNLTKQEQYEQYPFIKKIIAADIFDKELICSEISEFIGANRRSGCIIILSDDTVPEDEIDADALTYLVLVQDIINDRSEEDPGFEPGGIDLVVEILNPKNYDIVNNYSANNIVISNRYISKLIMQIGEKEAIYNFYDDILSYEEPDEDVAVTKELYIKKASDFFSEIPGPCTAAELIRAVYRASPDDNKSVVLGYFRADGKMKLFKGDQTKINVSLTAKDKLIIFSNK